MRTDKGSKGSKMRRPPSWRAWVWPSWSDRTAGRLLGRCVCSRRRCRRFSLRIQFHLFFFLLLTFPPLFPSFIRSGKVVYVNGQVQSTRNRGWSEEVEDTPRGGRGRERERERWRDERTMSRRHVTKLNLHPSWAARFARSVIGQNGAGLPRSVTRSFGRSVGRPGLTLRPLGWSTRPATLGCYTNASQPEAEWSIAWAESGSVSTVGRSSITAAPTKQD